MRRPASLVWPLAILMLLACANMQPKRRFADNVFSSDLPKLQIVFHSPDATMEKATRQSGSMVYPFQMKEDLPLTVEFYNTGPLRAGHIYNTDRQTLMDLGWHPLGERQLGGKRWTLVAILQDSDDWFLFGYYRREDNWLILVKCSAFMHTAKEKEMLANFRQSAEVSPALQAYVEKLHEMLSELFTIVL